jgi:hypothetical protein
LWGVLDAFPRWEAAGMAGLAEKRLPKCPFFTLGEILTTWWAIARLFGVSAYKSTH